jgi:MFS family permease
VNGQRPAGEIGAPASARWHVLAASAMCYGFDAMDFMMLALALPFLISEWGLSLGEAGALGTAGMIGVGLSGVVLGWFADRYGRRRALIAGVVIFALFTAALALARSRWDVMALRLLAGLGLGGVWAAVTTLINESWPKESRARAVSFVLSMWPVGVSLAAALAALVLPRFGALGLLAAVYVFLFVPESPQWRAHRSSSAGAARTSVAEIFAPGFGKSTLLGTLAAACFLTAYWGANTWLPTFLVRDHGLSAPSMGRYVLVLNAGMFCGYPLLGLLADRIGKRRALMISFVMTSVLLPIYASLDDLRALLWIGPVVAVFFAQTGIFGAYFPELYPTRMRSLGAGFCFNIGRGIAAFAPLVMGQIAGIVGLGRGIALCGVVFLLAGVVMYFLPDQPPYASALNASPSS